MALLGSSIDPRLQLQDYSGIVNAAQMQAQGLASIGSQIEAAAEQYKQYKKEQADTQKRVKAAANLADSISALVPELKGPLGATVAQLKDPNLTLADKDALAQSISSTLQLGIGVVAGQQDRALRQEEIGLRERAFREGTPEQRAAAKQKQDEFERQNLEAGNYAKGALKNLPPGLAKQVENDYLTPQNYDGIGANAFVEGLNTAKSQGYEFKQDAGTGTWYAINKNPPFDVQPIPAPMSSGTVPIDQSIQGAVGVQVPFAAPDNISGAIQQGVNAEDVNRFDAQGLPTRPAGEVPDIAAPALLPPRQPSATPDEIRSATEAAPATPQVPTGAFRTSPSPVVAAAEATRRLNELKIKDLERKEAERLKAEEAKKEVTASDAERYLANLGDYWTKLNESIVQDSGVIGANVRAFTQGIRGSEMNKLLAMKDTLDAEALVSAITKLRATSPTGATGLGSITDPERRNLIALVGNIDPVNIDIAKANTERLLEKVADLAYGTKPELDQLLKEGKINRNGYDQSLKFRQMALRGEIGKLIGARIREEREGPLPTNTFTPGVDDETEQLLKGRGF